MRDRDPRRSRPSDSVYRFRPRNKTVTDGRLSIRITFLTDTAAVRPDALRDLARLTILLTDRGIRYPSTSTSVSVPVYPNEPGHEYRGMLACVTVSPRQREILRAPGYAGISLALGPATVGEFDAERAGGGLHGIYRG